jgi:hypothetical protein
MTDPDFQAGERYLPDELPENQMDPNGKVELVGEDLFALALEDGTMVEFRQALEVTAVYEINENGEIGEVHSGERR